MLIRRVQLAYPAQGPLGDGLGGLGCPCWAPFLVKLIKGGSSPVTMAQEVGQGVQTKYQEEVKGLLLDLRRKVEKLYIKMENAGFFIGQIVEDGYWGVYEDLVNARQNVKDALMKLGELGVNARQEEEEEVKYERRNERRQVLEVIYNIAIELMSIIHYNDMLVDFTLKHKMYEYVYVDYTRRALHSALLNLIDAIYDLAIC